jgi:hypothetical protein
VRTRAVRAFGHDLSADGDVAWRADKVDFKPWPAGLWRQLQQVGLKT